MELITKWYSDCKSKKFVSIALENHNVFCFFFGVSLINQLAIYTVANGYTVTHVTQCQKVFLSQLPYIIIYPLPMKINLLDDVCLLPITHYPGLVSIHSVYPLGHLLELLLLVAIAEGRRDDCLGRTLPERMVKGGAPGRPIFEHCDLNSKQ